MSQAEHPKLAEGFEVFASSAQTALPPGRVPGSSLSLLENHSWQWLLTLENIPEPPASTESDGELWLKRWASVNLLKFSRVNGNSELVRGLEHVPCRDSLRKLRLISLEEVGDLIFLYLNKA